MESSIYRTTIVTKQILRDSHLLQNRWSLDNTEIIRSCIAKNKEIPSIFPDLSLNFQGITLDGFLDLRGINLSGTEMIDTDLSYCILDYANFSESLLHRTSFQYSRMISTNFSTSTLDGAQMSPIDAMHAIFNNATIKNSFFMQSNLDFIERENLILINTDFNDCSQRKTP